MNEDTKFVEWREQWAALCVAANSAGCVTVQEFMEKYYWTFVLCCRWWRIWH